MEINEKDKDQLIDPIEIIVEEDELCNTITIIATTSFSSKMKTSRENYENLSIRSFIEMELKDRLWEYIYSIASFYKKEYNGS